MHSIYPCSLCRLHPCGICLAQPEDVFSYHIDCYHLVGRQTKPLTLQDIWTIGIWTRILPKIEYTADAVPRAHLLEDLAADMGSLTPLLRCLPRELRQMVVDYSHDSPLWRLLSACHRVRSFQCFLNTTHVHKDLPLSSVLAWDRETGLIEGQDSQSCSIRLRIDDCGIKGIERLRNGSGPPSKKVKGEAWYIVESLDRIANQRVRFKVMIAYQHDAQD